MGVLCWDGMRYVHNQFGEEKVKDYVNIYAASQESSCFLFQTVFHPSNEVKGLQLMYSGKNLLLKLHQHIMSLALSIAIFS